MTIKFFGSTVRTVNSSLAWGEQPSQLNVTLVDDTKNGDAFQFPAMGEPAIAQLGSFTFNGIVQNWGKVNAIDGLPTYRITCTDPREILAGTQVIMSQYNGSTSAVSNLLNAYGYWEGTVGFGASGWTKAGMPWSQVLTAITVMTNSGGTAYGGPLQYRGYSYRVDLSQLPIPPGYYRIEVGHCSLLELISQVCRDGACDYFVELHGNRILVRTVSRFAQPPLGTISAIVNTNYGNVVRSESGVEARNETTSYFLVGGSQTTLYITDNITPYFGDDVLGNPILGTFDGFDTYMTLNSSEVADIIGSASYPSSASELAAALSSYDTWSAYVQTNKPAVATGLGLLAVIGNFQQNQGKILLPQDAVDDRRDNAVNMAKSVFSELQKVNSARMFTFINKVANQYLGRSFAVGIPFVLHAQDPETLEIRDSVEVAQAGYLPEGATPLGLGTLNQDLFTDQNNLFLPFANFTSLAGNEDLSQLRPGSAAWDTGGLFLRASVDRRIIYTPTPAVIMMLDSPVFQRPLSAIGSTAGIELLMNNQIGPDAIQNVATYGVGGNVNLKLISNVLIPDAVAVPLKSNILTYGPWYVAGVPGQVEFDQDETLTPWDYGGWDNMNLAATAKIAGAVTEMQVSEMGEIELVGLPLYSLGDTMQAGGPNITNINIDYGPNGVKTTYHFRTFSNRFGVFSRGNDRRIQRVGQTALQLRRNLRHLIEEGTKLGAAITVGQAVQATTEWLNSLPPSLQKKSPHTVFAGAIVASGTDNRVIASTMTYPEAIANANADNDTRYGNTAFMSVQGLLRPFTTQPGGYQLIPGYTSPTSGFSPSGALTSVNYNPFQANNDIEALAWGTSYQGMHAYFRGADASTTRAMAVRGPMVMAGWGYDLAGNPVPGNGSGGFLNNYLRRSDQWKVGPVDMVWDAWRGVWTSHDIIHGKTTGFVPANEASGSTMNVYVRGVNTGQQIPLWNYFSTAVSGSTKVVAGYDAREGRWYVIAADCS